VTLDTVGKECIVVSTTAPKVWRDRTKGRKKKLSVSNRNINSPRQASTMLVLIGLDLVNRDGLPNR
jgi:hypothetical protein